jgi:streptogramin lyase
LGPHERLVVGEARRELGRGHRGAGSVWVGNHDEKTLVRIDPSSRKILRRIGLPATPTDLVVAAGSVWVLGDSPAEVLRVDPGINDVVATLPLRRRNALDPPWSRLAAGRGAVWLCACWMTHGGLSRIDPAANSVSLIREGPVSAIAYGARALWALTGYENNTIEAVGPSTNVARRIPLGRFGETTGGYGAFIAAGAGAVWTARYSGKTLWKIDPLSGRVTGGVRLGHTPQGVATEAGAVWVVTGDGYLLRIDPDSQTVEETIPLGVHPAAGSYPIAAGAGGVWVATTP